MYQEPYQRANEEISRQALSPYQAGASLASIPISAGATGVGFGVGQKLLGKIAPFLSEYIPAVTAIKGISKVNPKIGKFIKSAEKKGKTPDEIKEFMTEKFKELMQNTPKTVAEKKVVEKTSEIGRLFALANKGKTQGNEFLKHASSLLKSGDIPDEETFANFYKWWQAKPSAKRGSPRSEFELFRNEIGNTLRQSKAAIQQEPQIQQLQQVNAQQNPVNEPQKRISDEEILSGFQKIMQM